MFRWLAWWALAPLWIPLLLAFVAVATVVLTILRDDPKASETFSEWSE
jgi:hypothetical protein